MGPNEVKEGIYVRPVSGSSVFTVPTLYEVVERTVGTKVLLIDCAEDISPYVEPVETTVMQVVQSMVRVIPEPDALDELLAA